MSKNPSNKRISLFGSHFSTIISVALVLLIIGFILIAAFLTHGADNSLRQHIGLVVRVAQDASESDIDRLSAALQSRPYAASVHFASAGEVYEEEMQYNPELLEALGFNPYSSEFDLFLNHAYVNSDSIAAIVTDISAFAAVDSVYSSSDVVDHINFYMGKATLYLSILGIVLAIISVVLIFNTVNLIVYSRRFLIHTMKLVGAKPSFIRRPFFLSGLKIGIIAGVVAAGVVCALHFSASSAELEYIFFPSWIHTAILCAVLIVLGAVFCSSAAYFAAARFIRYSYDKLFIK